MSQTNVSLAAELLQEQSSVRHDEELLHGNQESPQTWTINLLPDVGLMIKIALGFWIKDSASN